MSSLSNFAVNIYIARTLGAVQYGAFGLAYVTYGFALNASRGLATDPLLVRFSGTDIPTWRRAITRCTGTAATVGLTTGAIVLAVAALLSGTTRLAFLALGLTLPGLMLQDSWRYSFFALGRGSQAFLNDTVWTVVLIPALVLLRKTGHANVFWFVFAWGAAATVAAAIGPSAGPHRAPAVRSVGMGVASSRSRAALHGGGNRQQRGEPAPQLRRRRHPGTGGGRLRRRPPPRSMGPFMVIYFGMGLVTLPEAARILRRSPRHLPLFCLLLGGGLAILALAWGVVLLVALPRGLGQLMLGDIWKPTYPLVLPTTIASSAHVFVPAPARACMRWEPRGEACASCSSETTVSVVLGIAGAAAGGPTGAMTGYAVGSWAALFISWRQLRVAMQEYDGEPAGTASRSTTSAEQRPAADEPGRQLQS